MKTVIEMAREAGLEKVSSGWRAWTKDLAQFAELVRADAIADEREACAKVCESFQQDPYEERLYRSDFAAAIRARGEASLRSNT
jgi:hypothetical protein